jgi:protease-4
MQGRRLMTVSTALLAVMAATGCFSISLMPTGQMGTVVVEHSPRFLECNRIAVIDVEGFIGVDGPWTRAGTTVADLRQKLDMAAADQGVRAIVLRIDSPGGSAAASDTMFHEVMGFKEETGKPVVAALLSQAASGGYYVAVAADHIIASPTTVTGSIGAVMHLTNIEGLYKILGLKAEVIKSGEKKDIGSPLRGMEPEERDILDGIVAGLARRFIETVRERRPDMTEENLTAMSDGRVVSAQEAYDRGVIDAIGYLDDAIEKARELAGIKTADVILYRSSPDPNTNIYAAGAASQVGQEGAIRLLVRRLRPDMLYLWAPGGTLAL